MTSIDLNADLGEGAGTDLALLDVVSSASIACGGHAGTPDTMRTVLRAAKARNVTCGAHPGFADPAHFGRRRLDLPPEELSAQVEIQLNMLAEIAEAEKVDLRYIKLHGALANMAAEDQALAQTVFVVAAKCLPGVAVLALDNSAQVSAALALGLEVIPEAYADRGYTRDGHLLARDESGAVLTNLKEVVAQCLGIARLGKITSADGAIITTKARSICLHGDTENAVSLARQIRDSLLAANISISSVV